MSSHLFAFAALFSQVTVLAAVLALVVIIIMSIIILIAVWRKVRKHFYGSKSAFTGNTSLKNIECVFFSS